MWVGEQLTDKGIGNGVSLLIFAGIVLRYPTYLADNLQKLKGTPRASGLRCWYSLPSLLL